MAVTLKTKNSVTTTVTPTTLVQGELAVNIADKKMWVGNAATTPVQILGNGVAGGAGGSNTQVQYNSSGSLAGSANMVFDGSTLTTLNSAYTGTLTGGTGIVNLGSGQFYKDANGNIGINTTTPSTYTNYKVVSLNGTTGGSYELLANGVVTGQFFNDANGARLRAVTNTNLIFDTQAAERMRITSAGLVGIGTPSPTYNLDVVADANGIIASRVYNPNAGSNAYAALYFGNDLNNATAGFFTTSSTNGTFGGTNTFNIWTQNNANPQPIVFSPNSSERMRITTAGEVGIGSSTTNRLAMSYDGGTGVAAIGPNSSGGSTAIAFGTSLSGTYAEKMRLNYYGNVALYGATTNASGVGITFPATQSASSDANCLDDYEEGTWTPYIQGTSGTVGSQTYSVQAGYYVKIGKLVTLTGYVSLTNKGSWTASVVITGFPFAVGNAAAYYGGSFFYASGLTIPAGGYGCGLYPNIGTTNGQVLFATNTGTGGFTDYANQINNTTQLGAFTITYATA